MAAGGNLSGAGGVGNAGGGSSVGGGSNRSGGGYTPPSFGGGTPPYPAALAASIAYPHYVSDRELAKLASAQTDWWERARAILVDPKTSAEDREAVAKAVAERLSSGPCPGSRNPAGAGFFSEDAKVQQKVGLAEGASNGARAALIEFAKTPAGGSVRAQVRTTVCQPLSQAHSGKAGIAGAESYIKTQFRLWLQMKLKDELQKGLAAEKNEGNLRRLVQLHYVKDQATRDPSKWKQLDMAAVVRDIAIMEADLYVKKQLDEIAKESLDKAKNDAREYFRGRIEYLRSKEFDDYLALHDDDDARTRVIADGITPIAVIDPELATRLLDEMAARHVGREVNALTEERLAEELARAFEHVVVDRDGKDSKDTKLMSDASKRVAKAAAAVLKNGKPQDMFRAANAELAALHLTSEQASRFKTALKVFEHLDKNGHATSFASVLGAYFLIADTLAGKAFKDRAATLESFGNIAKTVDSAEGPVKLMAWTLRRIGENSPEEVAALKNIKAPNTSVETVAAGKATPAAKWLLRAKLLGPAGDLLMAASAKTKLEAAANAGDVNGALVNCGKYGSALVAFTPGAYLAAAGVAGFSTGPGAPIVWLIATGVYVGASLYEDSDQEKLMRKLQVHKDNRPK